LLDKRHSILGEVNPITNEENPVLAPFSGTILGMAENQFVSPGYLLFRIGIKKTEEEVIEKAKREAQQAEGKKTEKTM